MEASGHGRSGWRKEYSRSRFRTGGPLLVCGWNRRKSGRLSTSDLGRGEVAQIQFRVSRSRDWSDKHVERRKTPGYVGFSPIMTSLLVDIAYHGRSGL